MINLNKLLNLFNPMIFNYYWKQYRLIRKLKGRLIISSWRLSFENDVNFHAETDASITLGSKICLRSNTEITACYGSYVLIGDNFFTNRNCTIVSRYGITIGSNCMFGNNVSVYDHDHILPYPDQTLNDNEYQGSSITIGNNVWLGANVFIGKGVVIGDNVIIGAGTVVTKSIPGNSVAYSTRELIVKPRSISNERSPGYAMNLQ